MASTTTPSNKREPTFFDIKRPKSSNSVRRWLHILKHAAFKNHENDADSLKTKPSHDSAPCTPEPSPTEGESEDPQAEIEEPKEPTRSYLSSFTTPRSGPTPTTTTTTTTTSSEPLHQTLTSVPENSTSPNTTEAVPPSSSPSVVPAKKKPTTRPTASKPRRPRKPTMITPELMQQIQTSNRKHSSSPLLNASELPTRASGTAAAATATATNRAKEVLASPLRWSEQ